VSRVTCDRCGKVAPRPYAWPVWRAWTDGARFIFCSPGCRDEAQTTLGVRLLDETDAALHVARWEARP
jgi:hypothetical protein